ncbi:NADPH:quinone reductase [Nonomuraea sp. NPDC003707]
MHGELPDPEPGDGEVRVRVVAAGLNPRDVKRRAGAGDRVMTDARVIPGDDGAGIIDLVGAGVPTKRMGQLVWVHSATYGRSFGTSADYVIVPAEHAIRLPDGVTFEQGACLGVPALTAHRALLADGPVAGQIVLVTGGAGMVAHYAIELAKHAGATVVATASTAAKQEAARAAGADHVVDYRASDAVEAVMAATGGHGVDRVVDVAFGANLPLTSAVVAANGTISAYGSDAVPNPEFPFYSLMRRGITVRTVLVFAMPAPAMAAAIEGVTSLLAAGVLTHPIAARYHLDDCVAAHEVVESGGSIGKVLLLP